MPSRGWAASGLPCLSLSPVWPLRRRSSTRSRALRCWLPPPVLRALEHGGWRRPVTHPGNKAADGGRLLSSSLGARYRGRSEPLPCRFECRRRDAITYNLRRLDFVTQVVSMQFCQSQRWWEANRESTAGAVVEGLRSCASRSRMPRAPNREWHL